MRYRDRERVKRVGHFAPPFTGGISSALHGLLACTTAGPDAVAHLHADRSSPAELEQVDLVHCHHALRWPEAVALARRLQVPVVKTVHILQARQSRMRAVPVTAPTRSEALQARAIAEADALTIATHAAKAMLLEDHPGLDPARVTVLPLAPRLPILPRVAAETAHERPLVAATRFDTLKGTDLLIEVVALALRTPGRTFVVAGGLPDNARAQARWQDAFRAALTPEQVPRLHFVGWLGPDALAELLAGAAAFVTTSRLETCGLGLMEAVAAGCPAIATDLAVHREVAGTRADYVAADAPAFAQAIDAALRAPSRQPGSASDQAQTPTRWAEDWLHFWCQNI